MSFSAVGTVYDLPSFLQHIAGVNMYWAKSVTIHHTASPSIAGRPTGFTIQHMRNIQSYYQNELGWSRGPHLFTDEDQIFGMSPLTEKGIHAVSFNPTSIGIEMLGNYDEEDPTTGRGLQIIHTTAAATAHLLHKLGLPLNKDTVKFHRDDPKTSKTCPGKKITKEWFLSIVEIYFKGLAPAPLTLEQRIARLEALHPELK